MISGSSLSALAAYELEDIWDSETPSQSNYDASANPHCRFAWEQVRDSKRLREM